MNNDSDNPASSTHTASKTQLQMHLQADSSSSSLSPSAASHAAFVVSVIGVIEVFLFGGLVISLLYAASVEPATLFQQLPSGAIKMPQLEQIHPNLPAFAFGFACIGLLPGITYLLTVFGIRKKISARVYLAAGLAVTQCCVLMLIVIRQIVLSIGDSNPQALTVNVLLFGTPLAILLYAVRALLNVKPTRQVRSVMPRKTREQDAKTQAVETNEVSSK